VQQIASKIHRTIYLGIFHVLQIACRIPGHIFIFGIVCVLQIACGNHGHIYIWHKTCTVKSISISWAYLYWHNTCATIHVLQNS
jgi:hypothetical protein